MTTPQHCQLEGLEVFTEQEIARVTRRVDIDAADLGGPLTKDAVVEELHTQLLSGLPKEEATKAVRITAALTKKVPPPTVEDIRHWCRGFASEGTVTLFFKVVSVRRMMREQGLLELTAQDRVAEAKFNYYQDQRFPHRRAVAQAAERVTSMSGELTETYKAGFVELILAGKVDDVAIFFFCCLCMGDEGKRLTLAFFRDGPIETLVAYNAAVIMKMSMFEEMIVHDAFPHLATPLVYTNIPSLMVRVTMHNRTIATNAISGIEGGSPNGMRSRVFKARKPAHAAAGQDRVEGGAPYLPVQTLSDGTQATDAAPVKEQFDVVDRQLQQAQQQAQRNQEEIQQLRAANEQARQQIGQMQQAMAAAGLHVYAAGPMLTGSQPQPQAAFEGAQQQGHGPMQPQLPPYHMPQQAAPYVPSMNDLATALLNNARDNARAQSRHERDMRDLKAMVAGRSRARRDGKGGGEDDSDQSSSDEPADKKKKTKAGFQ